MIPHGVGGALVVESEEVTGHESGDLFAFDDERAQPVRSYPTLQRAASG
jgi:hypothetical protein